MDKKDNKLFRKLLTNAILKLYGANYNKLINDILIRLDNIEVNDLIEFNNKIDFLLMKSLKIQILKLMIR